MKTIFTSIFLFIALTAPAQKLLLSGYSLKLTTSSHVFKNRDFTSITVLSAPDDKSKKMASAIADSLNEGTGSDHAAFGTLTGELSFRFNTQKRGLRWSEWITGFGYSAPFLNGPQEPVYMLQYAYYNPDRKLMIREVRRRSGLVLDNKFLFNSSPFSGRLMFCGGLGLRTGYFSETISSVRFMSHAVTYPFPETKDTTVLFSNTAYTFLEGYASVGIKYRISCRIGLFTDVSLGKGIRQYQGGLSMPCSTTSLSIGIKYKINRSLPQDTSPDMNAKDGKESKKGMEVYW